MPVTRINNNQITDASAGNVNLGINANTKLQNFSITSNKIANNLTYGSDLTVTGNLTVQGSSTAIDTTITTIEDPVIVLASTQTGSPAVDIGFIGERGTANNIAFVWDESAGEFVTAFTNTSETSTTINIIAYANIHTKDANIDGNAVINGTTSLVGNLVGAVNATGNITGGNLLTSGLVSATGTVTSGANITGANILTGGIVSATGNVTGGNILTSGSGGSISGSGNITGGNLLTGGTVSAAGNITAGSGSFFLGNGSQLTGVTASAVNANALLGNTLSPNVLFSSLTTVGTLTSLSVSGTTQSGNLQTAGLISATGNVSGGNLNVTGNIVDAGPLSIITSSNGNIDLLPNGTGNVNTSANLSVTGRVTAASVAGGVITGTSTSVTGTQTAASTVGGVITGASVSVTGGVTAASVAGGVITGTSVSVTGGVTAASVAGGVITGTSTSVTGTQTAASTVGGVITGTSASVTGNITGANLVVTTNIYDASALNIITGAGNINLQPAGNVVVNNTYINGLAQPVQNQDAATKLYVDNAVTTAISYHDAVVAATTTTLATTTGGTVTYAQPNGVANGVGATLTTTGSFNLIDTANVQTVGTRILVKDQANAVQNGVYVWSNATVITRSSDTNTYGPASANALSINDYFFVSSGNVNLGSAWIVDEPAGTITFGTSNILFAQFSQSQVYSANTSAGLVLNGTVFSAKVDNNTTAFDGGNISVKAGANLTTPNIGAATGTSLSVTGTVTAASTVGGVITGSSASVTGGVTAASVAGGVITGSSASVTGNVSGGNLNVTGNIVDTGPLSLITAASGNVNLAPNGTNVLVVTTTGANITGTLNATGNATVGNLSVTSVTGTSISVTGGVTAASVAGGVITGTSTSVTGTQTAASTVGGVITGSSVSVTGGVTAASVAGGVITGTSTSVTGTQTAASTVGGVITGTSASLSGNVTGGNVLTSGNVSATGNVFGANFIGNISGNISAPGANTQVIFNDSGVANAVSGFTFNKASNVLTVGANVNAGNFNGNVFGTSVSASGTVTAASTVGGVITGTSASVTGTVTAASTVGGVISGSTASLSGNVTSANLILTSGFIDGPAAGRITINGSDIDTDFAVDGDTLANVFYVDAGTGTASFGSSSQITNAIVNFATTTSIKTPVGNTAQRPATGVTGMLRFNTTTNSVEVYDNSAWTSVGAPVFTVIADEQFSGNGVQTQFTLGSTQTTNSCIVSINGVVQIPTLAYAVAGTNPTCVLTFTEAPASGDLIDVRQITTTTTITSISNSSGNAVIGTSATAGNVEITGNIMPTANATANIGSATFSYNTIFAKATSAQYADLAEKYTADAEYTAGTVVVFGGTAEITINTIDADPRVAGVVSTNPSYIMNAGCAGEHVATVALTGRVPCLVVGSVKKGDLMVAAGNGRARSEADPRVGSVIGKALADSEGDATIEVVVGRF